MTGSFTDAELRAAVAELVSPDLGRSRDVLGKRRLDAKFEATQQAVVSSFLAEPSLLYSAAKTAQEAASVQVDALQDAFTQMRAWLRATLRYVAPITDLGPLQSAASAALALDSSALQKHRSLLTSPSYQQLRQYTRTHLQRTLPALRISTGVSPAPREARELLAQSWLDIQGKLRTLRTSLLALSTAHASLAAASLPKAASAQTAKKVRQALTALVEKLEDQTPEQRLDALRADTLQLVAVRAALSSVAQLPENHSFYSLDGSVSTFLDDAHPGIVASKEATALGPYEINESLVLLTQLGSGPLRSVYLPLSSAPILVGTATESYAGSILVLSGAGPFTIGAGTKSLQVFLRKSTGEVLDGSLDLTVGVGRTATQIAAEIQVVWTGLGVGALFTATILGASVRLQALGGGALLIGSGSANTPLTLTPAGGFVLTSALSVYLLGTQTGPFTVTTGVNDTVVLFVRDAVAGAFLQVTAVLPAGSQSTAAVNAVLLAALVAVGVGGSQYLLFNDANRVRFSSAPGSAYELRIGSGSANGLLGFVSGQTDKGADNNRTLLLSLNGTPLGLTPLAAATVSARTLASLLLTQLGADWSVTATGIFGQQRISIRYKGAGSSLASVVAPLSGLGSYLGLPQDVATKGAPLTAKQLASSLDASSLDVTASTVMRNTVASKVRSGPTANGVLTLYRERGQADLTSPAALTLQLATTSSTLLVGDSLLLDDGSLWTVTDVTAAFVEATGASTPSPRAGVSYDGGPLFSLTAGKRVQVEGGALTGTFTVKTQLNALQVQVDEVPAVSPSVATPFAGQALVGDETVMLSARTMTTLVLTGAGAFFLFGGEDDLLKPQALWVTLTTQDKPVVGDAFQVFESNYAAPTFSASITQLTEGYARIGAGIEHAQTWPTQGVVPVARVRNARDAALSALEASLAQLLDSAPPVAPLDHALRQVLVSSGATPTPKVQAALVASDAFISWLGQLDAALAAYQAPITPSWLRLLKLMDQQGSDRSKDLLSSCRFVEFFALDLNGASYEGTLASSMRKLFRDEMPVDKRNQKQGSTLVSQVQEDDPAYTFDDEDTTAQLGKTAAQGFTPPFKE